MNRKLESFLLGGLLGKENLDDERIRQGINQAGNYTFYVIMFLLWLTILFGLFLHKVESVLIPFIIFMLGCVFYLYFRIKNGTYQIDLTFKRSRIQPKYQWIIAGVVYALALFIFITIGILPSPFSSIYYSLGFIAVNEVLWVFLNIWLNKYLVKINNKRLIKKNG